MSCEKNLIVINNNRFMLFLYFALFVGMGLFTLTAAHSTAEPVAYYISYALFAVSLVFLFNAAKNKNAVIIDDDEMHVRKLIGNTIHIKWTEVMDTNILRIKNTKYVVVNPIDKKNSGSVRIMTLFLQGYRCEDFKELLDKKICECKKNEEK